MSQHEPKRTQNPPTPPDVQKRIIPVTRLRKTGGRSLAPKDWDTEHEVAWNWLWENVERILKDLGNFQVRGLTMMREK